MAILKIKSTNESSWSSSAPANLSFRELGLHNNHIYFGNKDNVPVRLIEEADLENFTSTGGKLKAFDFGPNTGLTYTTVTEGEKTRYSVTITSAQHQCGLNQNLMVNFFELDGSVYRGAEVDYTIGTDGTVTIYSDDSSYTGRVLISGAVAPNAQAEWGEITGSIESQTDLVNYISENISSNIGFNTTSGLYNAGNIVYVHDGSWIDLTTLTTSLENSSINISTSYSGVRNYYTTQDFNSIYVYITGATSSTPITITFACKINDTSYNYDINPVNDDTKVSTTYHYKDTSWDNITLVTGGWLVYTCKVHNDSNFFWTRGVYSNE